MDTEKIGLGEDARPGQKRGGRSALKPSVRRKPLTKSPRGRTMAQSSQRSTMHTKKMGLGKDVQARPILWLCSVGQ